LPRANKDNDVTRGLSLDPDTFLAQHARRQRILRMQDIVRPGRTTSVSLRLDRFTLERLKALATLRKTGYQTLLKEFVVERLYEEEKRAGIVEPCEPATPLRSTSLLPR
jgi:hypothetical protein